MRSMRMQFVIGSSLPSCFQGIFTFGHERYLLKMIKKVIRNPACNMYFLEMSLNGANARTGMLVPWWAPQSSFISASAVES